MKRKYFVLAFVCSVFIISGAGVVYATNAGSPSKRTSDSLEESEHARPESVKKEPEGPEQNLEARKASQINRAEDAIERIEARRKFLQEREERLARNGITNSLELHQSDLVKDSESVEKIEEIKSDIESSDTPEEVDENVEALTELIAPAQE